MKKSDHPYEHGWAHQALLELMCVAGPEMQPYETLEYRQKLHGGFPDLQKLKKVLCELKMKHVCLWKKAFPDFSIYIPADFFGVQLQAEHSLQESSELPVPLFPLMQGNCSRIHGCPAVPHGGKITCSEYCRQFSSLPERSHS